MKYLNSLTFEVPSATLRNNSLGKTIKYADYSWLKSVAWSYQQFFFPTKATNKQVPFT